MFIFVFMLEKCNTFQIPSKVEHIFVGLGHCLPFAKAFTYHTIPTAGYSLNMARSI